MVEEHKSSPLTDQAHEIKAEATIDAASDAASASSNQQYKSSELPEIKGVESLKAGFKGRNFESFTGTLVETSQKVLVKLYKRLPLAKIDEAENQRAVYSVTDHPNVISCLSSDNVVFRGIPYTYFVFPAY